MRNNTMAIINSGEAAVQNAWICVAGRLGCNLLKKWGFSLIWPKIIHTS